MALNTYISIEQTHIQGLVPGVICHFLFHFRTDCWIMDFGFWISSSMIIVNKKKARCRYKRSCWYGLFLFSLLPLFYLWNMVGCGWCSDFWFFFSLSFLDLSLVLPSHLRLLLSFFALANILSPIPLFVGPLSCMWPFLSLLLCT